MQCYSFAEVSNGAARPSHVNEFNLCIVFHEQAVKAGLVNFLKQWIIIRPCALVCLFATCHSACLSYFTIICKLSSDHTGRLIQAFLSGPFCLCLGKYQPTCDGSGLFIELAI